MLKFQKNFKSTHSLLRVSSAGFGTKQPMYASEAFVETLEAKGVKDIFGIVGSAFMDALDIMPAAGIRFIPCQHEQNSVHMADGYYRVSGKTGTAIG